MNPWGICPESIREAALTLDVWGTASGDLDGAIEISPGSAFSAADAEDLVAGAMRGLLDPNGRFRSEHVSTREIGGGWRWIGPADVLHSPTCVLTMSWDEHRRRASGPGFGPLGVDRRAPAAVRPVRDLIEWTLHALGHTP